MTHETRTAPTSALPRDLLAAATSGVLAALALLGPGPGAGPLAAQAQELELPGSPNVEVAAHVPLEGGPINVADVEVEQEPGRPFAYVSRARYGETGVIGVDVIDLSVPEGGQVIHRWRIDNPELHQGPGALDPKYFRRDGRVYLVQSFQFGQGGPNADLGAIVFDVTGLPEEAPEEVARVRMPEAPGGFHNIFLYHHSDGRALLFATNTDRGAAVFDLDRVLAGEDSVMVTRVPLPESPMAEAMGSYTYHDFYLGWHPESGQDRFYGAGSGGYFVYDVTDLEDPRLLVPLVGIPGVNRGHTATPSPDGRWLVGETERLYAPLRIFDLKPGLDGEVQNVRIPVSGWTADWRSLPHNHEVRWPYVFVAHYESGLQIFQMLDPANPKTVGYYDTYPGPHRPSYGGCGGNICIGAFGVDVRNRDGLIVVSDDHTGFWAFRLEGFNGWDGDTWGVPDVSSAQDWSAPPGSE